VAGHMDNKIFAMQLDDTLPDIFNAPDHQQSTAISPCSLPIYPRPPFRIHCPTFPGDLFRFVM
jgi:hypothetical protein